MVEIHKIFGQAMKKRPTEEVFTLQSIFYLLKLSYFLHKHQMKATKNSQAYTVGTHGCV